MANEINSSRGTFRIHKCFTAIIGGWTPLHYLGIINWRYDLHCRAHYTAALIAHPRFDHRLRLNPYFILRADGRAAGYGNF